MSAGSRPSQCQYMQWSPGSHFVQDGDCSLVVDVHEDFRIDSARGLLCWLDRWLGGRSFEEKAGSRSEVVLLVGVGFRAE